MLYIGCRLRGVFIRSVGGNAFHFFFGALFPNLYYVIILILSLVLNTDVISIFSLSLSRNNRYGNCCSDYNAVCKGSGPPVPPPPSPPPSPPGRLPATCQEVVYGNPAVRKLKNSKYAVSPEPFLNNGVAWFRWMHVSPSWDVYMYTHILLYYIYIYMDLLVRRNVGHLPFRCTVLALHKLATIDRWRIE